MEFLRYLNDDNDTTSAMANDTSCEGVSLDYIPTVDQYRAAMGGYGIALLTVGLVATAALYCLFIQQAWFTFSNCHKIYRHHIYWLTSIYPFVTMMTTVAIIVPRTHLMCAAIKIVYMSIGVGHFVDLTLLMYGSENKMLHELKDEKMRLNLLPLCCWYPCLPKLVVTKLRLMFLKWMIWQMKWIQAFYFILMYVAKTTLQNPDGTRDPSSSFLAFSVFMTVFNFSSFLGGAWAINIIGHLSGERLQHFRYTKKEWAVKGLTITVKLQKVIIFDFLGLLNVFPCLGPHITPVVFQNTLENSLFLVEMIILGLFSYSMYRLPEFKDYEQPVIPTTQSSDVENGAGATNIQVTKAESGSSGSESAYGSTASRDDAAKGPHSRGGDGTGPELLL